MTSAEASLEWSPADAREPLRVEIVETGWAPWYSVFKVHHYLANAKQMPFSTAFTGFDADTGDPVAFVGMSGMWAGNRRVGRACRLVVHPEWQGAGVGMRFLKTVCQREVDGVGFIGAPVPVMFHTAHPALLGALRRDPDWRQVSQKLVGGEGSRIRADLRMTFGGHYRSVAGFRFDGSSK